MKNSHSLSADVTGWNDTGLSGEEIGRLYAGEAWDAVTSLPRIEQVRDSVDYSETGYDRLLRT